MSLESFKKEVENGRLGRNHGLSIGLPKLEEITGGLTKSTFTLLFASSGIGKSSAALYSYVYIPLKEHLEDDKIKIIFFALEMKESFIIAKLLSTYLYDTYHIRISAKQILSIGKDYTLPDDIYEYVKLGYEWLEKVYKKLIIFDGAHTSDKVISEIMQVLKEEGTFEDGHYTPNNPEQTVLAVIDHAGLLIPANGRTKKGEIDECANKLVVVRNKTDLSVLFIMQSNRSVANMDRKKNEAFMEPMVEDIKETGTLTQYLCITLLCTN